MKRGDFSNLADNYTKYRPSYNQEIVSLITSCTKKSPKDIVATDVGAGTGIFTKCLLNAGVKNIIAVEPNNQMRNVGKKFLQNKINFIEGSGEETSLETNKYDLVTMASAFHWPNTKNALKEFDRLLNSRGIFAALWNPRLTDRSKSESEVQNILFNKYGISSRVSSGLSGITDNLRNIIIESGNFSSVIYLDAVDVVKRTHDQYIGAWRSVNDIQSQLGKVNFDKFILDVERIIKKYPYVEVHYLTRAWIAFK